MSVLNENTIIGASAGGDYEIEQSLRFDDGAYLSRTPSTASNRRTWTWSGWVKLNGAGNRALFSANNPSSAGHIIRVYTNQLSILGYNGGFSYQLRTNQLFRDPSAWYHIVASVDTTQSTASNRVKMYVNGEQVTSFSAETYPSQNFDTFVNSTNEHYLGVYNEGGLADYFDGYLGEVNFIDGQALTPDSFGETGDYGEWKPIAYAGTYGTNGFYLPFEQDYAVEGFSTVIYEANETNRYIGGVGFQPDFLWFKNRDRISGLRLLDTVRGIPKTLNSDDTSVETTGLSDGTVNRLVTGLTPDGFTLGIDDGGYGINFDTGQNVVAWCWDMGGTTASNTSGSITSSVRANTTYGQSIVGYTGNGTAGATVGHGLASAPTMVIVKSRTVAGKHWATYHVDLGNTVRIDLESSGAKITGTGAWNSTTPTSSLVTLGSQSDVNTSSATHIMYAFHDVTGYSKFSSYEGTGGTHTITTGFAPAFVMIKNADASGNWTMWDNTRNPNNPVTQLLRANTSGAEETKTDREPSFLSTGFSIGDADADTNASGQTYIYMAFADTREYAYWYDQSGNNNDWTSNDLTESDVMVDSPTNNFCTLNPLDMNIDSYAITVSEGNLQAAGPSEGRNIRSTMGMPTGKWYWETCTTVSGIYNVAGIAKNSSPLNGVFGQDANGYTMFGQSGDKFNNNSTTAYGSAWNTVGDICGVAFDADNGTLVFYVNNSSQGTAFTGLTSGDFFPALAVRTGTAVMNFGQDSSFAGNKTPQGNQDSNDIGDFYYAPPTGFLALCTSNLPEVDVIPSEHFNTVLYTGNDSTNVITGVGFKSDLSWWKKRNAAADHALIDSVRGVTKHLVSNTTTAEITANTGTELVSFDSDGFTLGAAAQTNSINGTSASIVAWNWKAGGSASSNSNGSITSSVSANASAGFSIVSYTGTGVNATVGHGLSVAPEMIIVKNRDATDVWLVYHDGLASDPQTDYIILNRTDAKGDASTAWNDTAPTSTVFSIGSLGDVSRNNSNLIAYCFHSVDGYSKVGSYIGNGNVDGVFVHCGFKPKFIILKPSSFADGWRIMDSTRSPSNVMDKQLFPHSSSAEATSSSYYADFVSNGFKLRSSHGGFNQSGGTFIFMAFAENPFKHTNAR